MKHNENVCTWSGSRNSFWNCSCNKSNVTEIKGSVDGEFLISIFGSSCGGGVGVGVAASKAAYDIINSELKKDSSLTVEPATGKTDLEKSQSN